MGEYFMAGILLLEVHMEFSYRKLREGGRCEHIMFANDLAFISGSNGTSIVEASSIAKWKKEYSDPMTPLAAACFLTLFLEDQEIYCGEKEISVAADMLNSIIAENNISQQTLQIATWVYRRTHFVGAEVQERYMEFWYYNDVDEDFLFKVAARLDAEARAKKSKIHFDAEYGDTPDGHEEYFYAFW